MSLKRVELKSTNSALPLPDSTACLQLPPQLAVPSVPPPLLWNIPPTVTPTGFPEPTLSPGGVLHKSKIPVVPHQVVKLPELPGVKIEPWDPSNFVSELDQFEFLEPIRPDLCVEKLPEAVEQELECQKRKRRIADVPIDPRLPKAKRVKLDRMKKNRESAQKSREKKARHRAMLNEQVRLLELKNAQLKKAISLLTDQATEAADLRASNDALLRELQAAQREHERLQQLAVSRPAAGHRSSTISITNHVSSRGTRASKNRAAVARQADGPAKVEPKVEGRGKLASAGVPPLSFATFNSAFNKLSAASSLMAGSPSAKFPFLNDLLENNKRLMPAFPSGLGLPPLPSLYPQAPQPALGSPRIAIPPIEMN